MPALNGTQPLAKYEIAASSVIESGNLVALDASGKAVPASDSASITVIGAAACATDGFVEVTDGVFSFANDTADPLTRADRGKTAFVKNASTVDKTGGTGRIPAGVVVDVYEDEVYVQVTPAALLAAANGERNKNESDS